MQSAVDASKDKWPEPSTGSMASVPVAGGFWRKLLAFSGPGYLVAVGYMDPGNWATDIAGGSRFGYTLLSVILLSSLMAMLLQALSVRLGIASGRDLAQLCRERYGPRTAVVLWVLCEIAIVACDIAEVIGSAIALKLLFGLPLIVGAIITAFDSLLILALQNRGVRRLEAFILGLITLIGLCFLAEVALSRPALGAVLAGFVPTADLLSDPAKLYVAVGILGATVMPHNLYLHSAVVRTRAFIQDEAGRREAIRFATLDSTVALSIAFFINAGILILAAAAFHGQALVDDIEEAYRLLSPMLGAPLASLLFAVALLAAGQNSTVTATLAGQVVMEGFVALRLKPVWRRLVTRLLALVPTVLVLAVAGESAATALLIFTQVVLSLQLPFAVIPLVRFCGDRRIMGGLAASRATLAAAWAVAGIIVLLNGVLIVQTVTG
ncbi:Nramp family divalent metal transporter [Nitrospirillum sp. BR 11828]|uniref:Nramp family divalent metal transporter n=1 Tax=Nitrospirillum sp. BR 11828 TaxID=3104325 RepID=UPI002ACA654F|nr:Nramp family divalent metal transporter [Nitrospirillum sp. BR 11828]MDZ5646138.1 Nramp family divalent metal transporter [Nitrospirillum sp. BR 11828]